MEAISIKRPITYTPEPYTLLRPLMSLHPNNFVLIKLLSYQTQFSPPDIHHSGCRNLFIARDQRYIFEPRCRHDRRIKYIAVEHVFPRLSDNLFVERYTFKAGVR